MAWKLTARENPRRCYLHKSSIEGPCLPNRKGNNSWIPASAGMTEGNLHSVSCLLSPVSCLLSPVSRLLSPVSSYSMTDQCPALYLSVGQALPHLVF